MAEFDFGSLLNEGSNKNSDPESNYLDNSNPKTVRYNPYFVNDLRSYYESKGINDKTDDQLWEMLLDDENIRLTNTFAPMIGARGSWADVSRMNQEGQERFARLKKVAEDQPFFWQEGGRGLAKAAPSIAMGVVTDPLNILTGGAAAAVGSARGAAAALKGGTALGSGLVAGAKTGALWEAGIGAVSGAISSYGDQQTRVELGLQPEYSMWQNVEEAVLSGALSGTIGALIGGVAGGVAGGRAGQAAQKIKSELERLGYSQTEIVGMDIRQANELASKQLPPVREEGEEVEAPLNLQDLAKQGEESAQSQRDIRLASWQQALRDLNAQLKSDVLTMSADGVHPSRIEHTNQMLTEVDRLLDFSANFDEERAAQDLIKNSKDRSLDPKEVNAQSKRTARFEEDFAAMQALLENPVPGNMRVWLDTRLGVKNDTELPVVVADAGAPTPTQAPAPARGRKVTQQAAPAQETPPLEQPQLATNQTAPGDVDGAIQDAVNPPPARPDEVSEAIAADTKTREEYSGFVEIMKNNNRTAPQYEQYVAARSGIESALNGLKQFPDEVRAQLTSNAKLYRKFVSDYLNFTNIKVDKNTASAIGDVIDANFNGIPEEGQPVKFTTTENKNLRRRVASILENNPSLSKENAEVIARGQIIRDRAEGTQKKSNTRSAQSAIDEKGVFTTAGRSEDGRIQSQLKKSSTVRTEDGEEYGISGQYGKLGGVPTEASLNLEEAVAKASDPNWRGGDLIAYRANSNQRLADARGKKATRGELVWYDAKTRTSFRDWKNAYKLRNEVVPGKVPPGIANQMPVSLKTGDIVRAYANDEIDFAEFMRRMQAASTDKVVTPDTLSDAFPLQREDGKVALFIRKAKNEKGVHESRKARVEDAQRGLTSQDIIGNKSSIDDWYVHYVDPDVPDTAQGRMLAAAGTAPEIPPEQFKVRGAMKYAEFEQAVIPHNQLSEQDWKIINHAAKLQSRSEQATKYIASRRANQNGISGKDIDRLISNIEGGQTRLLEGTDESFSRWPPTDSGRRFMGQLLEGLYALQSRIAPDGVALPVADREAANGEIGRIFAAFGPEQVKAAQDFINRLNTNALPRFDVDPTVSNTATLPTGSTGDRVGSITFGKEFYGKQVMPQMATLYHEVFHWAYHNILSPAEKMELWSAVGKYYDENGRFDPTSIQKRSLYFPKDGGPTNAINSPAEFAANNFSMWAMQNHAPESIQTPDFWQRMVRYVKAIFDRFFSEDSIDPDLERVFARILPDQERVAAEVRAQVASMPDNIPTADDVVTRSLSPESNPRQSPRKSNYQAAEKAFDNADIESREWPQSTLNENADGTQARATSQYFEGKTVEEVQEMGLESRARFLHTLHFNYNRLNDMEDMFFRAHQLNDPEMAVEAAYELIKYLRGSAFTKEQARAFVNRSASATGTKPEGVRMSGIYGPYAHFGKYKGREGSILATHMVNKARDMANILAGRDVVGIDDAIDPDEVTRGLVETAAHQLDAGTYSVKGSREEAGKRILQLYRYGKRVKDNEFRKGSSIADMFQIARNSLDAAFENLALTPPTAKGNTRIGGRGQVIVKIGKFRKLLPGQNFFLKSDTARANEFTLERFIEDKKTGERKAILKDTEGNSVTMDADSADLFRRGDKQGVDIIATQEEIRQAVDTKVKQKTEVKEVQLSRRINEARGRTQTSQLEAGSPDHQSVRQMPVHSLEHAIGENLENTVSLVAADEIQTKRNNAVEVGTKKRPKNIPDNIQEVADYADEAFRMGDEDMDQWAGALQDLNGKGPIISFKAVGVIEAVEREIADTVGASRDVGIPASAPSNVREMLLDISHRKRRNAYNARTLAYRILNLANEKQISRREMAYILDADDVLAEEGSAEFGELFGSTKDPLFKRFRETVRSIGNALEEGGDDELVIRKLINISRRLGSFKQFDSAADYLPAAASTTNINKAADIFVFDNVTHSLLNTGKRTRLSPERGAETIANEVVSDTLDRLGYLTNGLLGGPLRSDLRRLTWYGDPFVSKASPQSFTTNAPSMTPSEGRFAIDSLLLGSPNRKAAIDSFIGKDMSQVANPVRFFSVPVKNPRAGITVSSGPYGSGIYLTNAPKGMDPLTKNVSAAIEAIPDEQARYRGQALAIELSEIRKAVNRVSGDQTEAGQKALSKYITRERAIMEILAEEYGVDALPLAKPVVNKIKQPFDLNKTIATADRLRDYHEFFQAAADLKGSGVSRANINNAFSGLASEAATNPLRNPTLGGVFRALADEIGVNKVNAFLKKAGYDSILTKDGAVILDSKNVRSLDHKSFKVVANPAEGAKISPSGPLISGLADSTLDEVPVEKLPLILGPISEAEPNRGITNFLGDVIRGRKPSKESREAIISFQRDEVLAATRSVGRGALRTNSNSLRELGFNWIANWFENHFAETSVRTAQLLFGADGRSGPLAILRSLPDSEGFVKGSLRRWARTVAMDGKIARKYGAGQPESHKKILMALRENKPRQWKALSSQEKEAAYSIREGFQRIFREMRENGINVGNLGEDYVPQVWSSNEIAKNKEEFITALSKMFEEEAILDGKAIDQSDFARRASMMYERMSNSEAEGVHMSEIGNSRSSSAEHLDYSRKLDLDRTDAGKALKRFLEDDLEAILVKYYEAAARRLELTKKFGNMNHGAHDYMLVAQDGVDGIAKLLSTNRIERFSRNMMVDDEMLNVTFADNFVMPFQNRPLEAREAAKKVAELAYEDPALARDYLMRIAVPERQTGRPSHVYERRVDAILAALEDFEGEKNVMTADAARFFDRVMNVANRKPIYEGNLGARAGRALRNFNSVTMLSFTTLSSLTDVILPIVRSGEFKAGLKAMRQLANSEYRQMLNGTGVALETLLHDRMTHLWGAADGKFSNAFFSATMLTPWTDVMRKWGASVGLQTFAEVQQRALKKYDPSKPFSDQSRGFKTAYRMLKNYGLEEYVANTSRRIDHPDVIASDPRVRTAMVRFADDSIFAPNPEQIPMWGQTPLGKVIFQLKSFPTMMMRMSKEVLLNDLKIALHDIRGTTPPANLKGTGNLNRGAAMLALAPLFGAGALGIKDVVQSRGQDDDGNPSASVRERRGHEVTGGLGFWEEEWDDETLDMFAGWYFESFMHVGGLGLMLEMIHDTLGQTDNGYYGLSRVASTVFGPSVGTAVIAPYNIVSGGMDALFDRTPEGNASERQAVREVVQRIPVIGGQRSTREGIVNAVAGDPRKAAKAAKKPEGTPVDFTRYMN